MPKAPPTQEAFDKLLAWLDLDRAQAGDKYEKVQSRLIKIFGCHGCSEPETLADDTIDRVISKIDWLAANYVGDPMLYFCGVARNVLKENIRNSTKVVSSETTAPSLLTVPEFGQYDAGYACLDQCLNQLPVQNRSLILEYYDKEGQGKIAHRQQLAKARGITLTALRLRAYHIRLQLRTCVELCLEQGPAR